MSDPERLQPPPDWFDRWHEYAHVVTLVHENVHNHARGQVPPKKHVNVAPDRAAVHCHKRDGRPRCEWKYER